MRKRKPQHTILVLLLLGAGVAFFIAALALGAILAAGNNPTGQAETRRGGEIIFPPVQLNVPAPDLRLTDLDGKPVALGDYRGKVVLVNNWATWCPPCRAEMPDLQAYYETHANKDFVIIGIEAGDSPEEVRKFVNTMRLTYPIWLDVEMVAVSKFRNDSLPSSYLIDRDGIMRAMWMGAINQATLEKYVTPLLTP